MSLAPRGFRARFARAVVALRFPLVVVWIALAVWLALALPTFEQAQTGSVGDLVPTNAEALEAELRGLELFGFPLLARTVIVQRDPDGLSAETQARTVERTVALNRGEYPRFGNVLGALPLTNALGRPPFSRERSTTALTYLFFNPEIGPVGRTGISDLLIDRRFEPGASVIGPTGAIPARAEQTRLIRDSLPLVELATGLLVLLAVSFHFRAFGAALVTLGAVAVAYLISVRLIAWVGREVGVSVPQEVEPVIVVLLFGVVTDYSIFFLSRFRLRLEAGERRTEAAEGAVRDLIGIIVTAGLTIVFASASLAFAELGFLQAFGPGMAMAVLIGTLVSITFVPALLAVFGWLIFWPRTPPPSTATEPSRRAGAVRAGGARRRSWAIDIATRRPVITTLVCVLALLAASSGVLRLEPGNPLIRGLPEDSVPREAYVAATQGFTPGILAPTVVMVEGPGIVFRRAALSRFGQLLEEQPGVAEVLGPGELPEARPLGAVLSTNGNAARFAVVLDRDPLGAEGIEVLRRLQDELPSLLARAGIPRAEVSVAGDTALIAETVTRTGEDLARVAPITVLVVLLMLAIFLRALVAPLYLVAASVLALGAALGLAVYVFQELLGYGEITYYVPFAAAVLLIALGSDYNVFLAGRIWDEARGRSLKSAVASAGAHAAGPIAVAGLVLALSFALLALVPIRSFREIAFTMGAGLLIDAFLVRTLLVPALVTMVGERSSWPGRRLAGSMPPAPGRA